MSITTDTGTGIVVALVSPAAATNVGADTAFTFASPVRHLFLHNKTAATVYYDLDAAATVGSPTVATGQLLLLDVPFTVLHLYTAAAQNVNGTADLNIVVKGWA